MRKLRVFPLLVLFAPLAGAVPPYQPPGEGVELKLENSTDEKSLLAHIYAGTDACNKAQAVGEVNRNLTTTVQTGQVTTVSLRGRRADISDPDACSVYFSFRAEAGFSYRARLQVYDGYCRLGFTKIELATNTASSAERVLRVYRTAILPTLGVCRKFDAAEKARLGL